MRLSHIWRRLHELFPHGDLDTNVASSLHPEENEQHTIANVGRIGSEFHRCSVGSIVTASHGVHMKQKARRKGFSARQVSGAKQGQLLAPAACKDRR